MRSKSEALCFTGACRVLEANAKQNRSKTEPRTRTRTRYVQDPAFHLTVGAGRSSHANAFGEIRGGS